MDYFLGNIINDYTLYKIIEGFMAVFSMVLIYLGIQIALTWKSINKVILNSDEVISQEKSFKRSTVFIFVAGFFMLIHELFEGLENAPDLTTHELFELIALFGLVLFFYEWHKILINLKKKKSGK